eukprot:TRINITY_DN11581_c0_g1_i3.p2 TRINITY_DN11581_c0_g1~~TRINITY_DN11581_c0_g1_i3.p2  ORF type:complete len:143 (-),score=27.78 TRINITY_DN11581_c0_g1_i3:52-480(-)
MLLLKPIFPGDSSIDQLAQIIKILGTPTTEQIKLMNPNNTADFKCPNIKASPLTKVFKTAEPLLIDLMSKLLVYVPDYRLTALEALAHPYFDELREQKLTINNKQLPELFDFTKEELSSKPELIQKLVPVWGKKNDNEGKKC